MSERLDDLFSRSPAGNFEIQTQVTHFLFAVCSTAEPDTVGLLKVAVGSREAGRQRVGVPPASGGFPRTDAAHAQSAGQGPSFGRSECSGPVNRPGGGGERLSTRPSPEIRYAIPLAIRNDRRIQIKKYAPKLLKKSDKIAITHVRTGL